MICDLLNLIKTKMLNHKTAIMSQITITKDFVEKSEEGFELKSNNFSGKINLYAETLGISPEQVAAVLDALKTLSDIREDKIAKRMASKAATINYKTNRKPTEKIVRDFKKLVEASPNCTPEMLEDLGMNNTVKIIDTDTKAPDLHVKMVAGVPHITYEKTPFEGIRLYGRINGGPYDFQCVVAHPYFDDTRERRDATQAELREYYAYFMKNGKEVGLRSKGIKITLEALD